MATQSRAPVAHKSLNFGTESLLFTFNEGAKEGVIAGVSLDENRHVVAECAFQYATVTHMDELVRRGLFAGKYGDCAFVVCKLEKPIPLAEYLKEPGRVIDTTVRRTLTL